MSFHEDSMGVFCGPVTQYHHTDSLYATQVKACFISIEHRFWIWKTTVYKFMKRSVCRMEVEDSPQLSFCTVITANNLIAIW